MIDYNQSIKLPFADLKKLLIGIIISFIPVISLIAIGYQLDTARSVMRKKFVLPEWKNFLSLFLDGLLSIVIVAVYYLPAFIILVVGLGLALFKEMLQYLINKNPIAIQDIFSELGALLFVFTLLFFLATYLAPLAVLRYIESRKLGYAFNIGYIINIAFSKFYPGPWIIAILLWIAISSIITAIFGIFGYDIIDTIGSAVSSFITGIIFFAILSQSYENARKSL